MLQGTSEVDSAGINQTYQASTAKGRLLCCVQNQQCRCLFRKKGEQYSRLCWPVQISIVRQQACQTVQGLIPLRESILQLDSAGDATGHWKHPCWIQQAYQTTQAFVLHNASMLHICSKHAGQSRHPCCTKLGIPWRACKLVTLSVLPVHASMIWGSCTTLSTHS